MNWLLLAHGYGGYAEALLAFVGVALFIVGGGGYLLFISLRFLWRVWSGQ